MNQDHDAPFPEDAFAKLGDGEFAYVRPIRADVFRRAFPDVAGVPEGVALYGLFSAAGEPIMLTDSPADALSAAFEQDLGIITLH